MFCFLVDILSTCLPVIESGCIDIIQRNRAMAPHSSTLAWKIPWTEEPGGLQSMGSLRVGHDWATSLHFSLSCIGDGNGNPLQCFCLENPRDVGAWWAAVYGVTQSRTRLKWLSLEKQNQKDVCEYIYRKRLIMKNWLTWFWRLACLHLQYDQFETRKIDGVDKGSVWRFLFQECWSSYSV